MLLAFIAIQGTQTFLADMWRIGRARRLFTDILIAENKWIVPPQKQDTYALDIEGVEPIDYKFVKRDVDEPGYYQIRIIYGAPRQIGGTGPRVSHEGTHPWVSLPRYVLVGTPEVAPAEARSGFGENSNFMDRLFQSATPQTANVLPQFRDLHRQIFGKDPEVRAGLSPLQESAIILAKIEADAMQRRITVPGIGLEFGNGIAPWFIALTVIGLVVQIRNQVRRTLLDPEVALNEPWLILDGRRGLEKVGAAGWAFALLVAPWITNGCLVAVITAKGMADGWVMGAAQETIFHLCLATLILAGGWSSITLSGELLRLRRLRLEKLTALMSPSTG